MQQRVLILHGWGGSDTPHWQSYLAAEIARNYGVVSFPLLEDKEFPDKSEWLAQLGEHLQTFQPTVVVCHSLANTLWFHACNEAFIKSDIEHLLLVAPPSLTCQIEELKTFFPAQVPKELHAKNVKLIVSDNDPYMTLEEAQKLQKDLDVEMQVIKDGGHLNSDSGYGEWSEIVELVSTLR